MEYDSGDFPAVLEKALALAEWDGFGERRAREPVVAASCGAGASGSIWR